MIYAQSIQITAATAVDTLVICREQAKKDSIKLLTWTATAAYATYLALTSKKAKLAYKVIGEVCTIAAMFVVWCGLVIRERIDQFIADCEGFPVLEPALLVEAASEAEPGVGPTIAEMVQANPEQLEQIWQEVENADFLPEVETVQEVQALPNWDELNTNQLREACAERGIRWNRANGGKHATKAQMIAWLQEVAIAS